MQIFIPAEFRGLDEDQAESQIGLFIENKFQVDYKVYVEYVFIYWHCKTIIRISY